MLVCMVVAGSILIGSETQMFPTTGVYNFRKNPGATEFVIKNQNYNYTFEVRPEWVELDVMHVIAKCASEAHRDSNKLYYGWG